MTPRSLPRAAIHRVLVCCPNWLGDTVMAIPAIRALRNVLPDTELWCLGPWVDPVLVGEPGIAWRLSRPPGLAARLRQAFGLRKARLDLALLLPNSFESALVACVAGARWRLGYAADGRAPLLTHPIPRAGVVSHQVAAYLALLEPLGVQPSTPAPTMPVDPTRRHEARRLLAAVGLRDGARAVGIQLGAAFGTSKLWAPERLGALAARLEGEGHPVVFLGSPASVPLLAAIAATMPTAPRSLVGRDHVAVLPALLGELAAVVSPDSGPAHVAAAVGTPVVAIFGPTDPRLTAPLGPGSIAIWKRPPCAPCFLPRCPIDHRCLGAITVDEVAETVLARARAPR